jgi:hypothetical protein
MGQSSILDSLALSSHFLVKVDEGRASGQCIATQSALFPDR